jgi:lysophospholipase L1-like esterase
MRLNTWMNGNGIDSELFEKSLKRGKDIIDMLDGKKDDLRTLVKTLNTILDVVDGNEEKAIQILNILNKKSFLELNNTTTQIRNEPITREVVKCAENINKPYYNILEIEKEENFRKEMYNNSIVEMVENLVNTVSPEEFVKRIKSVLAAKNS